MRPPLAWTLALLASGCGDEAAPVRPPAKQSPPPTACAPGEWQSEGAGDCLPAGLPKDGCAPGEMADGSACVPAGITACGAAFSSDGRGGCVAALPERPCAKGELAIPGDAACHAVAPCGAGIWGDVPVEASTEFVDKTFAGASDGTMAAPWTTIQEAIDAAAPGATVAIAAGSYAEDVEIAGTHVRLWGRCPDLVEISGSASAFGAVLVSDGGGTEIRDLAITGGAIGVAVSGGDGIVLDRVWIHDTGNRGLNVQDSLGVTELAITRSLVESTTGTAVFFAGCEGSLVDSVVRGSAATPVAVGFVHDDKTGRRARGSLLTSVVEGTDEFGVTAGGSDLSVERTVVRRIGEASKVRAGGSGLDVWKLHGERGALSVAQSVVESVYGTGVSATAADATIVSTVIRATTGAPIGGGNGHAVGPSADDAGDRATLKLDGCFLDGFSGAGVGAYGSDVTIDATLLRGGDPDDPAVGRGLDASLDDASGERSSVKIHGSVIEDVREAGIFLSASDLAMESTLVRDITPGAESQGIAHALHLQAADEAGRPTATVHACLLSGGYNASVYSDGGEATLQASVIEGAHEMGVFILGGAVTLEGVVVRDTLPMTDGFGRGIQIQNSDDGTAKVEIRGSAVERSVGLGVTTVDSELTMSGTIVTDTSARADGFFGDGVSIVTQALSTRGTITGSRIAGSARAGISDFGALVSIGSTELSCDAIDLDGEEHYGMAYTFEDLGGNVCTCNGEDTACKAQTSNLEPPDKLP